MGNTRQGLAFALICLIVIVFSVAGIVAAFVTHIELNIDGILLVAIGLVMGGLFTLMLFQIAREHGWLPTRRKKETPAAGEKAGPKSTP